MLFKWFSRLYHTIVFSLIFSHLFVPIQVEATPISNVFINEIHYENKGADKSEFIELAGIAGLNLLGWSLHFYNGRDGTVSQIYNFTDWLFNDEVNGFGFAAVYIPGIQNGSPDGIVLADAQSNIIQFLSYEGSFSANTGIASGLISTNIKVFESSKTPSSFSLQLTGQGREYNDFSWAEAQQNTFGSVNVAQQIVSANLRVMSVSEPSSLQLFFLFIILTFYHYKKYPSTGSGQAGMSTLRQAQDKRVCLPFDRLRTSGYVYRSS